MTSPHQLLKISEGLCSSQNDSLHALYNIISEKCFENSVGKPDSSFSSCSSLQSSLTHHSLKGHYEITVSLSMHAIISKSSEKRSWHNKHCCYLKIKFVSKNQHCNSKWRLSVTGIYGCHLLILFTTIGYIL